MIKVLIADDSVMMRLTLEKVLSSNPDFKVVGFCSNGHEVIEKVRELKPDVLTLDVEMPKMTGLEVLELLMEINPLPVVMVSSLTKEGAEETIKALESGAVDFFLKPEGKSSEALKKGFFELSEKIRAAAKAKIINSSSSRIKFLSKKIHEELKHEELKEEKSDLQPKEVVLNYKEVEKVNFRPEIIIIGISTGGPASLNKIIPNLKPDLDTTIIIAQHMPLGFTKSLASRLNQISKITVKEAENGEVIKKGVVYVAPSGFQTRIKRKFAQPVFNIEEDISKDLLFRPCIDVTFNSASDSYKDNVLGIIMTGMGNDGTKGAEYIKANQGMIFTQSEDSCVIASMPKSVVKAGFSDKTYNLDQMADVINNLFH